MRRAVLAANGPALPFPRSCRTTSPRSGSTIAGPRCSREHGDAAEPGRVLRHDGVAVQVATPAGERMVKLRRGVEPLTVGDWLALDGETVLGLLDRASLLRRRAAGGDDHQLLAANLDLVLLVCGLDRPVDRRAGSSGARRWRGTPARTRCWCSRRPTWPTTSIRSSTSVDEQHPGLERAASPRRPPGSGIDALRERLAGHTSVMLGESGAGKSSLVNAVLGARRGGRRRRAERRLARAATPRRTGSCTCCRAAAW